MKIKIVQEDMFKQESFEEQLNEVIDEIEEDNNTIKDIKVMSEQKVLIIYQE